MNAQQLKNSILQEAIEGRLVPQDPNDEPASVLLDRIRKEKARLVKEGKLKKKDLVETPISEEEIPFEIPESWEWVRLNYVSDIARGGSPRPIKEYITDASNGVNWIKISDSEIGGKYIYNTKEKIKLEGVSRSRYVHVDDFLLTNSMSFGRPYILKTEGCIHDGWLVISLNKNSYDQDFMYYLLSSRFAKKSFTDKAAGAVVKNLNIDKVAESIFPLPPLAEQKRIVEKIEQLLPKVEEYGKAQEALDKLNAELPERLKKSILQEAIEGRLVEQDPKDEPASVLLDRIRKEKAQLVKEGKLKKKDLVETPISEEETPFEIPESWKWCRLRGICDYIHRGKSPKYGNKEILPIIAQKCNQWQQIYTDRCLFAQEDTIERYTEEQYLKKGDVIINSTGGGTVGRTGYVDDYVFKVYKKFVVDSHVTIVRGNKNVFGKYLYYFLISPIIQFGLEDRCSGSTNQIELGATTICNYLIPLPPLAEQKRIVEKIEELLAEVDKLK